MVLIVCSVWGWSDLDWKVKQGDWKEVSSLRRRN